MDWSAYSQQAQDVMNQAAAASGYDVRLGDLANRIAAFGYTSPYEKQLSDIVGADNVAKVINAFRAGGGEGYLPSDPMAFGAANPGAGGGGGGGGGGAPSPTQSWLGNWWEQTPAFQPQAPAAPTIPAVGPGQITAPVVKNG
jgi:hypothetical protein